MTNASTPSKIIIWRVITVILLFLTTSAMVSNIVISFNRKIVYQNDINMVRNYNHLISYVARSCITLR